MPPKRVNTIKAVTKDDPLTLTCEWSDCKEVFDHVDTFNDHVTAHLVTVIAAEQVKHGMDVDNYDAMLCQWRDCYREPFPAVGELMRHVYFHAFHVRIKSVGVTLILKNKMKGCTLDASSRNTVPELPESLQCGWKHCEALFDNPIRFYSHVHNHVDVYPSGNNVKDGCPCHWEGCDGMTKNKHKLKDHVRSHTQEKLTACPTCGGLFANASKFYDHLKRQQESSVQSYQCSHCNKKYVTERLLKEHMRHHVNHYKCPFCDMTCPNPSSLRLHFRYRHTEERQHLCEYCEYAGKTQADLQRHLNTHSKNWLRCHFQGCDFRCRNVVDVHTHYRRVHEVVGGVDSKKYLCHLCDMRYMQGKRLTLHLKRKHRFRWPPGHVRFRYKLHEDGFLRLQTVRYESLELTQQLLDTVLPGGGAATPGASQPPAGSGSLVPASSSSDPAGLGPPARISQKGALQLAEDDSSQDGESCSSSQYEDVVFGTEADLASSGDDEKDQDDPGGLLSTESEEETEAEDGGVNPDYSYNLDLLGDVALGLPKGKLDPKRHVKVTRSMARAAENQNQGHSENRNQVYGESHSQGHAQGHSPPKKKIKKCHKVKGVECEKDIAEDVNFDPQNIDPSKVSSHVSGVKAKAPRKTRRAINLKQWADKRREAELELRRLEDLHPPGGVLGRKPFTPEFCVQGSVHNSNNNNILPARQMATPVAKDHGQWADVVSSSVDVISRHVGGRDDQGEGGDDEGSRDGSAASAGGSVAPGDRSGSGETAHQTILVGADGRPILVTSEVPILFADSVQVSGDGRESLHGCPDPVSHGAEAIIRSAAAGNCDVSAAGRLAPGADAAADADAGIRREENEYWTTGSDVVHSVSLDPHVVVCDGTPAEECLASPPRHSPPPPPLPHPPPTPPAYHVTRDAGEPREAVGGDLGGLWAAGGARSRLAAMLEMKALSNTAVRDDAHAQIETEEGVEVEVEKGVEVEDEEGVEAKDKKGVEGEDEEGVEAKDKKGVEGEDEEGIEAKGEDGVEGEDEERVDGEDEEVKGEGVEVEDEEGVAEGRAAEDAVEDDT